MNSIFEELLAVLLVGIFAAGGGAYAGYRYAAQRYEAQIAVTTSAQRAALADKERDMQTQIDSMTAQTIKEKQDAKIAYDALAARLRVGAQRVRVAVASCEPASADPGATHSKASAELLPETSASLVELARDADDTVRDLNECVDQYNAVKNRLDPAPAAP